MEIALYKLNSIIVTAIVCVIAFGVPFFLTVWNIKNFIRPKRVKLPAWLTVFIGAVLYFLLYGLVFDTTGDWYEAVFPQQLHNSISSEYAWTVILPVVLGFAGLLTLISVKAEKLPPLLSAICIAAVAVMNVVQTVFAFQIMGRVHDIGLMLYVYHFNIFVLSISAVKDHLAQQTELLANPNENEQNRSWLRRKIKKISQYNILIFACLFLFIAVLEIIFILSGQGADAAIKAFTDTADWTFSKQIPPPPKEYKGHYLCTVAAGGHKKVVKPLRLGTRHGATIIVNRQLCIANAFEDYIQEKLPRFHKVIRGAYDKYGYPVSKHITTPRRADAVYILMKPLEWAFLIFLYLFDTKPEQRISRQYRYQGENNGGVR